MKFYYDREEIWPDFVPTSEKRAFEGIAELSEAFIAEYITVRDRYLEMKDAISRAIDKQRSLDDNE